MYKKIPFEKIKDGLRENLNDKRHRHVLMVAESAQKLAEVYNINQDKALAAALLHDYAKGMSAENIESYIVKYDIKFDDLELESPELMHGRIARYIALYEYGIQDTDILNSVEFHTTGRKYMSFFEMIIILADYIEEGRDYQGVDEIRALSYNNPERALLLALNGTLIHLISQGKKIHPRSIEARNYLIDIKSNNEVNKI